MKLFQEFRMIVNLAINDSDLQLTFGERKDTFVEIPTSALRNGENKNVNLATECNVFWIISTKLYCVILLNCFPRLIHSCLVSPLSDFYNYVLIQKSCNYTLYMSRKSKKE